MEQPTAYDYMVGLLAVVQDMQQRTNKLESEADRLSKNLESLRDAKNLYAQNLHQQLVDVASDYHLADLHLTFAQKRIASLMESLKKKERGE